MIYTCGFFLSRKVVNVFHINNSVTISIYYAKLLMAMDIFTIISIYLLVIWWTVVFIKLSGR